MAQLIVDCKTVNLVVTPALLVDQVGYIPFFSAQAATFNLI